MRMIFGKPQESFHDFHLDKNPLNEENGQWGESFQKWKVPLIKVIITKKKSFNTSS